MGLMKKLSMEKNYRRKNMKLIPVSDGNYYFVNAGNNHKIDIEKIFPSLLKLHYEKKKREKEKKSITNVKQSTRKTKKGKIVVVRAHTKRLKDVLGSIFDVTKNKIDALNEAKKATVKYTINKYGYDPKKQKKMIKIRSKKLFTKITMPLYKNYFNNSNNNSSSNENDSNVNSKKNEKIKKNFKIKEAIHFGNFEKKLGGILRRGDVIYSRDISQDKNWKETLKKGGRFVQISNSKFVGNKKILLARVYALMPNKVVFLFNFEGDNKAIKNFIKKGAKQKNE